MIKIPRRKQNQLFSRLVRINRMSFPITTSARIPNSTARELPTAIAQSNLLPRITRCDFVKTLHFFLFICRFASASPRVHFVNSKHFERRQRNGFQSARTMLVTGSSICRVGFVGVQSSLYFSFCPTSVEVMAKVMVFFQLQFEETDDFQQISPCVCIVDEGFGTLDLVDGFVEVTSDSVLASTMQVSFLKNIEKWI